MIFYFIGTKFEVKAKLRAKSVNLEIKWANVRHKEKKVKSKRMRGGLKAYYQ